MTTRWDYDIRTLSDADRLPVLKKMGSEGWEMIGLKEEPRSGTPGLNDAATYITYWFKRPIEESVDMRDVLDHGKPKYTMDQLLAEEAIAAVAVARGQTTTLAMVDDPVLYLIVRMEDQNRILSIMSRAGYYIKDVTTDRKVDGAYVTYTFTQRKKT